MRSEYIFVNLAGNQAQVSRRGVILALRILGGLATMWIIFVVFLDIRHSLFPKTTIGGFIILTFALLGFALIGLVVTLAVRVFHLFRGFTK